MRANNMLGVLFSNVHDEKIRELTEKRAMGSVPFGGRYRLIDFPLSNMVNSGINKVGVITKNNYQSLMDHLGSGKAWDLSRKREGLFILPPFGDASAIPNSRVEYLASITRFLHNSREEYVALSDCDMICNIDYSDVLAFHLRQEADITLVYRFGKIPAGSSDPTVYTLAPDGRILDFEAVCEGHVGYETRGANGFGYDPIFYIGERSFAEYTDAEKDAISHRGKALRQMAATVERMLADGSIALSR